MLSNKGSSNHSHRTAQEMFEILWNLNFHQKNIIIAIFTGILYTSDIQSGASWHTLKFHGAN